MIDYEMIINNNIIVKVVIMNENGKKHEITDFDECSDELKTKINKVNGWLKIHPIGYYIMDAKEYQDYKAFILDKRYLLDCSNMISPLLKRAKEILRK